MPVTDLDFFRLSFSLGQGDVHKWGTQRIGSQMRDKVLCKGAFGTPGLVPSHGSQVIVLGCSTRQPLSLRSACQPISVISSVNVYQTSINFEVDLFPPNYFQIMMNRNHSLQNNAGTSPRNVQL